MVSLCHLNIPSATWPQLLGLNFSGCGAHNWRPCPLASTLPQNCAPSSTTPSLCITEEVGPTWWRCSPALLPSLPGARPSLQLSAVGPFPRTSSSKLLTLSPALNKLTAAL